MAARYREPQNLPGMILFTHAALLSLHSRVIILGAPPQICQSDKILVTKKGSPRGDLHERIDTSRIGTARQNRLHLALGVMEVHAILAPVVAVFD